MCCQLCKPVCSWMIRSTSRAGAFVRFLSRWSRYTHTHTHTCSVVVACRYRRVDTHTHTYSAGYDEALNQALGAPPPENETRPRSAWALYKQQLDDQEHQQRVGFVPLSRINSFESVTGLHQHPDGIAAERVAGLDREGDQVTRD